MLSAFYLGHLKEDWLPMKGRIKMSFPLWYYSRLIVKVTQITVLPSPTKATTLAMQLGGTFIKRQSLCPFPLTTGQFCELLWPTDHVPVLILDLQGPCVLLLAPWKGALP